MDAGGVEGARRRLAEHGQEHVLCFWGRLTDGERSALLRQIDGLDLDRVDEMRRRLAAGEAKTACTDIEPADALELSGPDREAAAETGGAALRRGEVGVLLVAGGQGSRLGFDGPKGAYPIAPVSNATLFEIHARKVLALTRRHAAGIPLYIMTSPANDRDTRAFFDRHAFFGLDPRQVSFFAQGMWPALWPDGRMVLDSPSHIFLSPDGHGGLLNAMRTEGLFEDLRRRGIQTLFYCQVDNPLVEIADPAFVGQHLRSEAQVSLKVCAKRDASEGLGVAALRNGRPVIVEYSELTEAQKTETRGDGHLRFLYGSVAIHVFDVGFLEEAERDGLPIHLAHKKVTFCDNSGRTTEPSGPNAYKFEKFVFDVLPRAERVCNVVFRREDEFSPVKNAEGPDSPRTARRDMVRKAARRLEACGVEVPRDEWGEPAVAIEIDPCYAADDAELRARIGAGFRLESDLRLA